MAEHDDVDVASGDVEPAHVLDHPIGRDARVEQDPGRSAGLLDRDEA